MTTKDFKRSEKRFFLAQRMSYSLLAIILFIYGLIIIRNFLYPIAFGFLLAYLIYPVAYWLEKKGLPRILANFITILGALFFLAGLLLFAYNRILPVAGSLPKLAESGITNLSQMIAGLGEYFGFDKSDTEKIINNQTSSLLESGAEYFQALFSATTSTIVAFGLLPVYIFLFLYYRTKFMYFLLKVAGRSYRVQVIAILREISTIMVRYMAGVIVVVFILFFINSLGLWLIGIKYPIALGVTAAIFNFIPYFGTLLGGLVPFLFALIGEGNLVLAFRVVLLFIVIQFIENNLLTPNIVGGNVKINPFFIITGLVAASMIWGIPGMLLIVPFLAVIRIVFSHIDFMKPYAFLLGEEGTRKHSITLRKIKGLWQKKEKNA